jgi:aspartokinase/homoserine dehydrogenase 1
MKVLKFGGSSVATPERIENIVAIIKPRIEAGEKLVLVFSAFGGVTDQLIEMSDLASKANEEYQVVYESFCKRHLDAAKALLTEKQYSIIKAKLISNHKTLNELLRGIFLVREASLRTMDYVLSFGERNSNYIISEAFKRQGINTGYVDARKFIKTNKDFGKASVNFELTNPQIQEYFGASENELHAVTGFIATDVGGLTTTLGRGGSDYTAAILAGALKATVLEIWTDVDGVLTSDPRKVKKAFSIPLLSYSEAMEMSHFGAKVIYPPTIQPALAAGIPIYIKNTLNPTHAGTRIHETGDPSWNSPIKGISALKNIALLSIEGTGMMGIPGVAARLFGALANNNINVILITQASSEHSISFAVEQSKADEAKEVVENAFASEIKEGGIKPVKKEGGLCVIAVIGEKMKAVPGVAGLLFQALGRNGINVIAIAQGSSELNISFVINEKDESKALNLIHDAFFLSETKTFNLFLIGVGLIGGTLIDQIKDQNEELKKRFAIDFKVAGIANSKTMVFDENGLDLEDWKKTLEESNENSTIQGFINGMKNLNLSNSIFVDNTANKDIPDYYKEILEANISITTPNKVATSSSYASYKELKKTAIDKGIYFLYETNVGAGLPILSTIKNLINSGDKIEKIEAVVSGSLSYIFNQFDGREKFSTLVQKAKELGYTEPDPREDLSGQDVKRKITILGREAGFEIEPEEVMLKPILPDIVMVANDVDEFFIALESMDSTMKKLVEDASSEGKVLRFIAETSSEKSHIALRSVDINHPFYGLSGADNMIVITSQRYQSRPLVVKGPGAGAEVTAGGVFADLLIIANIN